RTCGLEESDEHTHDMDCFGFVYAAGERNDAAAEGEAAEEMTADAEETAEEIQGTEEAVSEGIDVSEDAVKHVHTAECYARGVICGKEEHNHVYSCYFGDVPEKDEEEYDPFDNGGVVLLNSDADDEETEYFDAAEMMVGASQLPETIETVDNIAEGIRFNLFDYVGDELESQHNNYDISWDSSAQKWVHNNIKYTGINSCRNSNDDILFFAYGTPSFTGTTRTNDDTNNDNNKYTRTPPDKNNYSGDYNTITDANFNAPNTYLDISYSLQVPGNRPVSGIVNDIISSEYPYPSVKVSNHSLDYLFNPAINENSITGSLNDIRKVYTDVNHILRRNDNNHLVFDSDRNYAYFNEDTNNFTVYNTTFDIVNSAHHKANDIDPNSENGATYGTEKDSGFKIGFFPFDQYDDTRKDPNYDGEAYNHHFGMTMEASFKGSSVEPDDVNKTIMFSYSGDDDMWVFVDDVLVLDVGGIHEPTAGMIDFTHGIVWTQDNALQSSKSFDNNFDQYASNPKYPKPMRFSGTNDGTYNQNTKWEITSIEKIFTNLDRKWNPDEVHTIRMFYLERGGCYSNLAMDMFLPTTKNLVIEKEVNKGSNSVSDPLIDEAIYEFELLQIKDGQYICPEALSAKGIDNKFKLRPWSSNASERIKVFENLPYGEEYEYVIKELNVNSSIYSKVKVNGTEYNISNGSVISAPLNLSEVRTYVFENIVKTETSNINVDKKWIDAAGSVLQGDACPNYDIKFKLFREDSANPSVKVPVAYVVNDVSKRTFILNKTNNWTFTFDNLPTAYGNHRFTYTAQEVNSPSGYNTSYSYNGNNIIITNTNKNKVDIYAKKEWENISESEIPDIKLLLKRKYVEYSESETTSLKVIVCDERGNTIKEFNNTSPVYVGGSVELKLETPLGSGYYPIPQNELDGNTNDFICNPDTVELDVSDAANGYYEISNLAEEQNTVKIHVNTNDIHDDLVLIHHSFNYSPCGWEAERDNDDPEDTVAIGTSSKITYATGDALYVKNADQNWKGAKLYLDPAVFRKGRTYTFSAYVYSIDPDTDFQFVFCNGFTDEGDRRFKNLITTTTDVSNEWKRITSTYTLPEFNPYGMYLKIQHSKGNGVPDIEESGISFRVDEFLVVEGTKNFEVDENGVIRKEALVPGSPIYDRINFNNVTYNRVSLNTSNFISFGETNISYVTDTYNNNPNNRILVQLQENVENASTLGWRGAQVNYSLTKGHTYLVRARVSPNDADTNRFELHFKDNGKNKDMTLGSCDCGRNYEQQTIQGMVTVPSDSTDKIFLYIRSDGTKKSFRIYDFEIYDVTSETHPDASDWRSNGSTVNMKVDNNRNFYVSVTGRNNNYEGAKISVGNRMEQNKDYLIRAKVSNDSSGTSQSFKITFNNGNSYKNDSPKQINGTSAEWIELRLTSNDTASIASNANLYIESDSTASYRIYGFQIIPLVTVEKPDGFSDSSNGYYYSLINDEFRVAIDYDSATNPLHLGTVEFIDPDFKKVMTKNNKNDQSTDSIWAWDFHSGAANDFNKLEENSSNKRIYTYYVEELEIGSMKYDAYKEYYEVSIKNNNVSNNDSDTPIIVHNKYIWYRLPATGGRGTTIYFIGGIALILLGITGAVIINRRRSKNN
ncbi:MAG: carbohydrate binding domain-containing protein, partial [Bacilli bacterium]|nr:carbohydrate binding domain-containing protein [Bacilli bacterium]